MGEPTIEATAIPKDIAERIFQELNEADIFGPQDNYEGELDHGYSSQES